MDPPKPRKKREASLKKKEKGHAYSARHARISLAKAGQGKAVPHSPVLANGATP
jgi:hypothetical protein